MNISLYDFEKSLIKDGNETTSKSLTDEEINNKYFDRKLGLLQKMVL